MYKINIRDADRICCNSYITPMFDSIVSVCYVYRCAVGVLGSARLKMET